MSSSVRILVVKTSSMGDVVHALPAVTDIATAHPGAIIDWVCEEGFAGIPAMHPAVDRVIPCAIRRWRKSWWRASTRREVAAFRASLRAVQYDITIDFQGLLKSAWIVRGMHGTRHGYAWGSAREPLSTIAYDVRHEVAWGQHAIVRNRQLAAASLAHSPEGAVRYGIGVDRRAQSNSDSATGALVAGAAARPTMIALHATSRADKAWPEGNWRTIVQRMIERGFDVILPWGSEAEHQRSDRIARGIGGIGGAIVPDSMDMHALARLFSTASIVVGVDTGLVHLAVAVGAPTLAIFGPTDPALTGVIGERANAINVGGNGDMPGIDRVDAELKKLIGAASG